MSYKLGILGGMGPSATASLYQRIIDHTKASKDQDHIKMVILNNVDIPDRTLALLEGKENPLPKLNEGIDTLVKLECEYFVIPCNTAHAYAKQFNLQGKIKFISMVDTVHQELLTNYPNKKICLLGTNGTKEAHVYERKDININYPLHQDEAMQVVTNTKAGLNELERLQKIINEEEKNCDLFLLACTENSLYKDKLKSKKVIIDAMDLLVKEIIKKCGKEYK